MRTLTPEQAREYLERTRPESLTLLDVRQPSEYEEEHLPGSVLIPLGELTDRLDELDAGRPVLAYCRSGGRSLAAAGLLEGQGFREVMNLDGGMMAWEGAGAVGDMRTGMDLFRDVENAEQFLLVASGMEEFLRRFYATAAERPGIPGDVKELLERLAAFEDKHKQTIFNLYARNAADPLGRSAFDALALGAVAGGDLEGHLEGGVAPKDLLPGRARELADMDDVLDLAMMIEAQALDLYMRCRRSGQPPEVDAVLEVLAREEKAHLRLIARFRDEVQA